MSRRVAILGAPSLLLAVAALHAVLVLTTSLTAWKGGGFGMFSTAVDPSARFLKTYVTSGGQDRRVPIPPDLAPVETRLRAEPTRSRVARLAEQLLDRATDETGDWPPTIRDDGATPSVTAVHVEVWIREYVSHPPRLEARRLFTEAADVGA